MRNDFRMFDFTDDDDQDADAKIPLSFCDIGAWVGREPPPREWAVSERFPLRAVGLFSGDGAVGKTILLMQLGVAHILGKEWLFTLPEPRPFLYLNAEDEEDELWRRFTDVAAHYGASVADLKDDLHLLALAGQSGLRRSRSKWPDQADAPLRQSPGSGVLRLPGKSTYSLRSSGWPNCNRRALSRRKSSRPRRPSFCHGCERGAAVV